MTAIRKDKDSPEFIDVYLTESKAFFASGFDPSFEKSLDKFELSTLAFVDRSQALISKSDGTGRFKVYFNFGAKWSKPIEGKSPDSIEPASPSEEPVNPESLVTIECEIVAEFSLSKRYEQAYLDNFALSNAVDFVAPYWKNYLINQCGLMRIQKLPIPDFS
ncbi:hypothetical protein HU763_006985 [Pseudomonas anuradhapurensis]|uniref:hypothetical protein n=1 Tax=Pseudomonas anuradhapurensis TaxID=485870 RepID=UPI001645E296|nr:hypothetical protein [Pseudomonas anuradhapurensis]QXI49184.1 hypothetical protein HU763_006985 [Pseudomonas anuradhapurensis]